VCHHGKNYDKEFKIEAVRLASEPGNTQAFIERDLGIGQGVFPMPAAIRQVLPNKPGIYRMRSLAGTLLYIGNAKSLKKRVTSYFRSKAPHPEYILEMLSQARDIDFSLTESVRQNIVWEKLTHELTEAVAAVFYHESKPVEPFSEVAYVRSDTL
jgi:hypothetical protein